MEKLNCLAPLMQSPPRSPRGGSLKPALRLPGNDVPHQRWLAWGPRLGGSAQNASVTRNGFSAKLHESSSSTLGAEMSLLDQINIASVISAPCFIIPALQGWLKSQRKLMGQIKDNGKCIWSSTFILDTAVVFSPSEQVLNMPTLWGVSVTLRGYPYFPLATGTKRELIESPGDTELEGSGSEHLVLKGGRNDDNLRNSWQVKEVPTKAEGNSIEMSLVRYT